MSEPIGYFSVSAEHPCLAGHFPGRPVVPGALLLDEVFGAITAYRPNIRVSGVIAAKFLAVVHPGETVAVHDASPNAGRLDFDCRVGDMPVLRGTLRLATEPPG
jgi:3-hydroxyacyl-[acyl-carrier-protein] dehydratase